MYAPSSTKLTMLVQQASTARLSTNFLQGIQIWTWSSKKKIAFSALIIPRYTGTADSTQNTAAWSRCLRRERPCVTLWLELDPLPYQRGKRRSSCGQTTWIQTVMLVWRMGYIVIRSICEIRTTNFEFLSRSWHFLRSLNSSVHSMRMAGLSSVPRHSSYSEQMSPSTFHPSPHAALAKWPTPLQRLRHRHPYISRLRSSAKHGLSATMSWTFPPQLSASSMPSSASTVGTKICSLLTQRPDCQWSTYIVSQLKARTMWRKRGRFARRSARGYSLRSNQMIRRWRYGTSGTSRRRRECIVQVLGFRVR